MPTLENARRQVKIKFYLGLEDATFDNDIDAAIEIAVASLSGRVRRDLPPDTSITLSGSQTEFDLPTSGEQLRYMLIKTPGASDFSRFVDWFFHGRTVYLREMLPSGTQLKLLMTADYTVDTMADLPKKFDPPLYHFACSEYAATIAGDRARYNVYMNAAGARAVDNMLDTAQWYENRAHKRLERIGEADE